MNEQVYTQAKDLAESLMAIGANGFGGDLSYFEDEEIESATQEVLTFLTSVESLVTQKEGKQ